MGATAGSAARPVGAPHGRDRGHGPLLHDQKELGWTMGLEPYSTSMSTLRQRQVFDRETDRDH